MPLPDASADVVISNGVFNLCPDNPGVLAEAFRSAGKPFSKRRRPDPMT